ncbi:MAG: hypothetical protein HYS17_01360 [Micavibrio aeruginosavorus]|uniref:Type 4 secretion system PilS N-terminal domain-containing protein n=1 Tax=Micavibrio aeruginosavorus TaxID=349221 RepID=A0A7T5UGP3_9BACT|nr:MAG: hypothetical protein HYS17_01360 [Micavibrio aeruginosavorus]
MNTSRKSTIGYDSRPAERGNAMIYVLIAIVLFAALTLIVARQSDNSESGTLDTERVGIAATQIIQTSMQLKQGVDQMLYGGTDPANLDFVTPDTEPAFSAGPSHVNKVFHPSGGGLVLQALPAESLDQISADPPARWYIGRFNNIEWSKTIAEDVIMVAHQISTPVCRAINQTLLGNPTPLATTSNPRDILIDDQLHGGTNADFMIADCPACEGVIAGCLEGPSEIPGEPIRSFYSLILSR